MSSNKQVFTYDVLDQLTKVATPTDTQTFEYDKVGNRTSKNGSSYTYYSNTNRLQTDHRNYTYTYDNNGNIVKRSGGSYTDSLTYDWNNRLIHYKVTSGSAQETLRFVYNASGLRIKKYYRKVREGPGEGEKGSMFIDITNDLGIKSQGEDSVYDKGRDIQEIQVDNSANYLTFTIQNQHLFKEASKLKLFITLDIDTIANSGRISLPEDSMTKVSKEAAWEYCIYIADDDYGYYTECNKKISKPFGMAVQKVTGDSGTIELKLLKSMFSSPQVLRYTVSTFDPKTSNNDLLWQGGSSAADVYPGTPETFGGEINGYGEISPLGEKGVTEYTILYVYDGINPVVEYSPNGSILAKYIYAGGLHIAKIAGADTHWYHCDALGSPRKMTNESGAVVWSATYYPFGEMTASGSAENTHGFTGKEYDSEMGLNYFCQRYYDPQIGRFITRDLIQHAAYSTYAYCVNNPLRHIDPLGFDDYENTGELPPIIVTAERYDHLPILPTMTPHSGMEKASDNFDKYWEEFKYKCHLRDLQHLSKTAENAAGRGSGRSSDEGGDPGPDLNDEPEFRTEGVIASSDNPTVMPPQIKPSTYINQEKLPIGFFSGAIYFKLAQYTFKFVYHAERHHPFLKKVFYPEGWRWWHWQLVRYVEHVKGSGKTLGRFPTPDRLPGPMIIIIIPENYMKEWYGIPDRARL